MKVWINSLQLIIEKMKDEEKWHNNYINILSRRKKNQRIRERDIAAISQRIQSQRKYNLRTKANEPTMFHN